MRFAYTTEDERKLIQTYTYYFFNLEPNSRRFREQVTARKFISKFIRRFYKDSLDDIAEFLSYKTHGTIITNLKALEGEMSVNKTLQKTYEIYKDGLLQILGKSEVDDSVIEITILLKRVEKLLADNFAINEDFLYIRNKIQRDERHYNSTESSITIN